MNTNLTTAEIAVIVACMYNDFGMGDSYNCPTWRNCINDSGRPSGVEGKALSGTISSLNKKGWLRSSGAGAEACVAWASEEAFDKAKALAGK